MPTLDLGLVKGDTGLTGSQGIQGIQGVTTYFYVVYASDASGTGFTTTFNASLNYIATKLSSTPLTPVANDFTGLWFNYKGTQGIQGIQGLTGVTDIIIDLTPQLGGELDINSHSIGGVETDNGNSGTSKAIDWRNGNHQKVTMTGNCTFTFTAPSKPCALSLRLINDTTAGRTITLPTMKWQGGTAPVWTKLANAIDILNLYYDGAAYYGMASLAWA